MSADASSLERLAEIQSYMHEYDACEAGKRDGGEFTARMYFQGTVEMLLSFGDSHKAELAEAIKAREAAEQARDARDAGNPCGQAIDGLWRDIIIARFPDYGDWDYAAQAYRHILAEYRDAIRRAEKAEAEADRFRAALQRISEVGAAVLARKIASEALVSSPPAQEQP